MTQPLYSAARRLAALLGEVREARPDHRSFMLFERRDDLADLGIPDDWIVNFDPTEDAALDRVIAQATAMARRWLSPEEISVTAATPGVVSGSQKPPLFRLPDPVEGRAPVQPNGRLYRTLFVSPEDAQSPVDRLQIVPVSNANDEEFAKVDRSIRYLNRSRTARETIDEALRRGVKLNVNGERVNQYNNQPDQPGFGDLEWDPKTQLRIINNNADLTNAYMSPAAVLAHEFAHSLGPKAPYAKLDPAPGDRIGYDDNEEQRVIDTFDRVVADDLGEPIRTNHGGWHYRTNDPTSWVAGEPDYTKDKRLLYYDPPKPKEFPELNLDPRFRKPTWR